MKTELIISGFWLLLAAYLVFAADKLGLGAIGRPGPGFFPFGAAIAVAIITSIRLLRARHQEPPVILATRPSEWRKIGWRSDFWTAVVEAQRDEKPVLLWAMNGHPCGET